MIAVGQEIAELNLHELGQVRSIRFQVKIIALVVVTAVMVALTLYLPTPLWILPSLILGLAYAHAVELQHQCLHSTGYKTKAWNRVVGVLLGLPSFVSFSDYQNSHLKHHRLLGTPEDKEFFNYSYQKLTSLSALIPHLWMVRHYRDVVGYIFKSVMGKLVREKDAAPKMAKRIRFEYQLMALFLFVMAAITIAFQTAMFLKLWFIPFLIAVPVHALIELPEHIGCNTKVPNVLENTRTIKAGKFAVWFVDGNNYHVEHHWLPGVPNDRFVDLHSHVVSKIVYLDTSYWSFYQKFFLNLRKKNLHRPWDCEGDKPAA
ncbi:MAG TPA: fatty acid desaturase [Blastocatellia bacterium]|jgi:fatty acid desaturase|nr:fatty acid desaturase [Blastocatellia bacterium]